MGAILKYRDKRWLRSKYIHEGLSTYEIAEIAGCSDVTIGNWLKKFNIETREQWIDELDNRYGLLHVVKRAGLNDRSEMMWLCECDCGENSIVSGVNLRKGETRSCGHLIGRNRKSHRKAHRDCQSKVQNWNVAFKSLLCNYQYRARKKSIQFNLSEEEFMDITQRECEYCRTKPSQIIKTNTSEYVYNGVDRVNSNLGYTLSNTVSCCGICNLMKGRMNLAKFLKHIEKIFRYTQKGDEPLSDYTLLDKERVAFNRLFYQYQYNAEDRSIKFGLSKIEFAKLTKSTCKYCGSKPKKTKGRNKSKYVWNGVDRVNNNLGYIPDNVVSCCSVCNRMKRTMSRSNFLAHVMKIYKHSLD